VHTPRDRLLPGSGARELAPVLGTFLTNCAALLRCYDGRVAPRTGAGRLDFLRNAMQTLTNFPKSRDELIAYAKADASPLVSIDLDALQRTPWPIEGIRPMTTSLSGPVGAAPANALAFLLLMTSVNYRFWRIEAGSLARYSFRGLTGARALWAAFEIAWGTDEPSPSKFEQIFRDQGVRGLFGEIPGSRSRAEILTELLENDIAQLCAKLTEDIGVSGKITIAHAAAVASTYPKAYADPYLKKAQLALALYGGYLRGRGDQADVSDLTAFADYQVPRVLRALGVLRYSDELAEMIDRAQVVPAGSVAERAIRSATILACEAVAAHCDATAADIDNLLWASQDVANDAKFHLTPTTWY